MGIICVENLNYIEASACMGLTVPNSTSCHDDTTKERGSQGHIAVWIMST